MSQSKEEKNSAIAALQWHIDQGVDVIVTDTPIDRTLPPPLPQRDVPSVPATQNTLHNDASLPLLGSAEAIIQAEKLANSCNSLEELSNAIQNFEGLSVKKTATNMVFADGDQTADIMLIGEAPGADEDRQGKPFVGLSGQLLDKILAAIIITRNKEETKRSVYISNILNWRPPGNRTPTDQEIAISLPFIEKHIALIKPKILILCGGVSAKSILRRNDSISKLRGTFHDYQTADGQVIKVMATYHPAYLLRTPAQKKAVWADMIMLQNYIEANL